MLGRGRIQSWDKVAEDSMVPTLYPVGGKAATGAGTWQLGSSGIEFQVQRKSVLGCAEVGSAPAKQPQ